MILTRLSRAVVFRLMRLRNRLSHLVGLDRGLALLLLTALIVIRIWDPMPVEELRPQGLRRLSSPASAAEHRAAGRHSRHRRAEPADLGSMALVATTHGGDRAQAEGDGCGRGRLRHRLRRAGQALATTVLRGRRPISTRPFASHSKPCRVTTTTSHQPSSRRAWSWVEPL